MASTTASPAAGVFDLPICIIPVQHSDRVEASLHPLVVMALSDHFTAHTVVAKSSASSNRPAIGLLLGTRGKRLVEVYTAVELLYTTTSSSSSSSGAGSTSSSNNWLFDKENAIARRDSVKSIYGNQDVVGWYVLMTGGNNNNNIASPTKGSSSSVLSEALFDAMNAQVKQLFEVDGPLVLVADMTSGGAKGVSAAPAVGGGEKSIAPFPINLLETPTDEMLAKNSANTKAKKINFNFSSTEVERIGTDMLFRLDGSANDSSSTKTGGRGKKNEAGKSQVGSSGQARPAGATASSASPSTANGSTSATTGRSLEPLTNRLGNSVSLLKRSIDTVIHYIQAVQSGVITDPDCELLRSVMAIVQSLPCGGSYNNNTNSTNKSGNGNGNVGVGGSAADRDFTESLLIAYASVIQKSAASLNELQSMTAAMVDEQHEYDDTHRKGGEGAGGGRGGAGVHGGRSGGGRGGGGAGLFAVRQGLAAMMMGGMGHPGGLGQDYYDDNDYEK